MNDRPILTSRRGRAWIWPAIATVAAVIAIIVAWYLAIPRYEVCIAIYPTPPGCGGGHRLPGAGLWTGVLIVTTGLTYAAALLRRAPNWMAPVAAALTIVLAFAAYFSVLYW